MSERFLHSTVHQAADGLRGAIEGDAALFGLWQKLTPHGRNEFICWVDDAKQAKTRQRRIQRTGEEQLEGKNDRVAGSAASTAPTRNRANGCRMC